MDKRVAKAVEFLLRNPNATVPESMAAVQLFSSSECANRTIQQQVRRAYKKRTIPSSIVAQSTKSTISSLTNPSVASSSANDHPDLDAASALIELLTAGSAISTEPTSSSKRKKRNSNKLDGLKEIRLTSSQAQKMRVNNKMLKDNYKMAFKEACILYSNERENGKSAQQCCDEVGKKYNTTISKRTVQHYVQHNKAGESPRKGPDGGISPDIFKILVQAYESYVRIKQINAETAENSRNLLSKRVNNAMNTGKTNDCLFQRIQRHCTAQFTASVSDRAEERRLKWTTYANIKMWFDSFDRFLVEFGFGSLMEDGSVFVSDEQKARILNVDETALLMDGTMQNKGGRPTVTFFNGSLPVLGAVTSKTSQSTTMITGSNALGEVIPPHFQFSTTAKSSDREKLRLETVRFMKDVRGKFGHDVEKKFPCTFGLNEKGGMDKEEFEKYILHSILPLYPDSMDIPGKRVLIKIDSGPGRMNRELMARLRLRGFYMFPCVPNTTAVTQETDRKYAAFKTKFRANLNECCADRILYGKPLNLAPWMVGLFVFGGCDPETGLNKYADAFAESFTKEKCVASWEAVGAVPPTRACLKDSKVRREVGDSDRNDETQIAMAEMQMANMLACDLLSAKGFQGHYLKAELKKNKVVAQNSVTVPNSKERIEALAKASTHGALFAVTGGDHFTSDDMFMAAELPAKKAKIARLKEEKKVRLAKMEKEEKAMKILSLAKPISSLTVPEVTALLHWYDAPKDGKLGEKRKRWEKIVESGSSPPSYLKWTEEDEAALRKLEAEPISIKETALGRMKQQHKQELFATFRALPKEEREAFIKEMTGEEGVGEIVEDKRQENKEEDGQEGVI